MLDSDIAALFELPVRRINEQMKRNPDRFPEDFCFQLTQEEVTSLSRSQFAITMKRKESKAVDPISLTSTPNRKIIALARVLRSGQADKMAVEEAATALVLSRAMPLGRLASEYGDFESKKAFRLEGCKMFLLNRYLDEAYNVQKDSGELSTRIQKC